MSPTRKESPAKLYQSRIQRLLRGRPLHIELLDQPKIEATKPQAKVLNKVACGRSTTISIVVPAQEELPMHLRR